jgi:hypothetical protein
MVCPARISSRLHSTDVGGLTGCLFGAKFAQANLEEAVFALDNSGVSSQLGMLRPKQMLRAINDVRAIN